MEVERRGMAYVQPFYNWSQINVVDQLVLTQFLNFACVV